MIYSEKFPNLQADSPHVAGRQKQHRQTHA